MPDGSNNMTTDDASSHLPRPDKDMKESGNDDVVTFVNYEGYTAGPLSEQARESNIEAVPLSGSIMSHQPRLAHFDQSNPLLQAITRDGNVVLCEPQVAKKVQK